YLSNALVGQVTLADYENPLSALYDPTIERGDNYANRYAPVTASFLGSTYDTVAVQFGGSGAIDNISYTHTTTTTNAVPEPMSMILFGTGFAGLGVVRRKKLLK
ncbi:MAG: PEP-CTERM sorting domain-containing protein, partial [Candidatus Omnitrophica bacterium]|nr:PEP-CTERM sorting domain-containing protein [Candidatus Omnitrophota bacterium]